MRISFARNRHRAGWRGRIFIGRRFIDIGWYHYDPTHSYLRRSSSAGRARPS